MVQEARRGTYLAYGVEPNAIAGRGPRALLTVVALPPEARLTAAAVRTIAAAASHASVAKRRHMRIIEARVVQIGNREVGLVEAASHNAAGVDVRTVQYLVPGRVRSLLVTVASAGDAVERYRSTFMPILTQDIVRPRPAPASGGRVRDALIVALLAAAVALVAFVVVRISRTDDAPFDGVPHR